MINSYFLRTVIFVSLFIIPCALLANEKNNEVEDRDSHVQIVWASDTIYLKAFPGTSVTATTAFLAKQDFDKVSLRLTSSLRKLIGVSVPNLETISNNECGEQCEEKECNRTDNDSKKCGAEDNCVNYIVHAGVSNTVVLVASVPLGTSTGTHRGTLRIRYRDRAVSKTLKIILDVESPTATVIPDNVALPTPDRLVNNTVTGEQFVLGEVLLQAKPGTPPESIKTLVSALGGVFLGSITDLDIYQIQFPAIADSSQLTTVIQQLSTDPIVEFATKSWMQLARKIPNDPFWGSWSGFTRLSRTMIPQYINLPSAWNITVGSKDVKIAIIDTGFQRDHKDLKDNVGSLTDLQFLGSSVEQHGTAVAGIIGATGNNGIGLSGVMWDVDELLYAVKVPLTQDTMTFISVISAMNNAIDNGAKIINFSGGIDEPFQWLTDSVNLAYKTFLLDKAKAKDVVFVFAAGEDGMNDRVSSPSSLSGTYQNVISVTSSGLSDQGIPTNILDSGVNFGDITVAAPGVYVYSTWPGNFYGANTGTSFATPLVTGLAGLIRSVRPDLPASRVKQLIIDGAIAGGKQVIGHNFYIIDAYESLKLLSASPIATAPEYAYVANGGSNNVSQYTIGSNGSLTPMGTPTVAAGSSLHSVTVDPSGKYVYVGSYGNVLQYTVGSNGSLTPMGTPTVAAGSFPLSVTVDPSGKYVYVGNYLSNTVSQYTIGSNGSLTPMTTATVAAGTGPDSVVTVGSYSYATVPAAVITANPARLASGSSSTITWHASNVNHCTVTSSTSAILADGDADAQNNFSLNSPQSVVITGQTIFTINCTTNSSPVSSRVIVNILPVFGEF